MSKKDEIAAELSQQAGLRSTWKSLVEHPGWALFEATLREQCDLRMKVMLNPIQSMGAALSQEFYKGEIAALETSKLLPHNQIEMLTVVIEHLNQSLENENEDERAPAAYASRVDDEHFSRE